ncbi:MAG: hypothetical protein ACYDCN_00775 [Bacteroidia bacterium]
MQNIKTASDLKAAIQQLEIKQANELVLLKEQFSTTYESLKPLNILKRQLKEVVSSPEVKNSLLATLVGLAGGYISKKVMVGGSKNPIKKIIGTLLELGVANIASKNPETIKWAANTLVSFLSKKKEAATTTEQNDMSR